MVVWIWVERGAEIDSGLDLGLERRAKIGGDLKQINGEPNAFTLPSNIFGPCGGSGRSNLVVEDRPW